MGSNTGRSDRAGHTFFILYSGPPQTGVTDLTPHNRRTDDGIIHTTLRRISITHSKK